MEFHINREGLNCKVTKRPDKTAAIARFNALCDVRHVPGVDLPTPCKIFCGSDTFCIDSVIGKTMSYRRAALELAGVPLRPGRLRIESICKTPRCVEPAHIKAPSVS